MAETFVIVFVNKLCHGILPLSYRDKFVHSELTTLEIVIYIRIFKARDIRPLIGLSKEFHDS